MTAKNKFKRPKTTTVITASPSVSLDPLSKDDKLADELSGKTKLEHTVEVLILEWAFFYGAHSPTSYLQFKGYSKGQIVAIFSVVPTHEWQSKRETAQNRVTETLVKRHVDIMAAVQDEHIKSSKLALAKSVQMLANGDSEYVDKDGKKRTRKFSSHDLLNCTTAIEKAQKIYRTAMGLPNDEAGMSQILKTLQSIATQNEIAASRPTQSTEVHLHQTNVTVNADRTPHELTHEDILLMIEAKREQKAKQLAIEAKAAPAVKEVVVQGDYTALKR